MAIGATKIYRDRDRDRDRKEYNFYFYLCDTLINYLKTKVILLVLLWNKLQNVRSASRSRLVYGN